MSSTIHHFWYLHSLFSLLVVNLESLFAILSFKSLFFKNGGAKITEDFIEGCKRQGVTRSIFVDAVRKAHLDVSSRTPGCELQAAFESINEILAKYT